MTSEITSESNTGPQLVIWGTDVVVDHCKSKFRKFIQQYVDTNIADDERFEGIDPNQPVYLQRLEEVRGLWMITIFSVMYNRKKHTGRK